MKIIRPRAVTAGMLSAHSVAEPSMGVNPDPAAWAAGGYYVAGDDVHLASTHRRYRALTSGASMPLAPISTTPGNYIMIPWVAHGRTVGSPVAFAGAPPPPLVAGTVYYVSSYGGADSFSVVPAPGDAAGSSINGTTTATYSSVQAITNVNNNPATSPTHWRDIGATNKFAMFDPSIESQTTNLTTLTWTISAGVKYDSVALMNVTGNSVRVQIAASSYDKTIDVRTRAGATALDYEYEAGSNRPDVVFLDLPTTAANVVVITITADTGAVAGCGLCITGLSRDIGKTKSDVNFGITDYSKWTTDDFGNTTVTQRAYSKTLDVSLVVDNTALDEIGRLLTWYRATPIVWVATESYSATIAYGFCKDWGVAIARPTTSDCRLTIAGVT